MRSYVENKEKRTKGTFLKVDNPMVSIHGQKEGGLKEAFVQNSNYVPG
jgi:hypothetical protein